MTQWLLAAQGGVGGGTWFQYRCSTVCATLAAASGSLCRSVQLLALQLEEHSPSGRTSLRGALCPTHNQLQAPESLIDI